MRPQTFTSDAGSERLSPAGSCRNHAACTGSSEITPLAPIGELGYMDSANPPSIDSRILQFSCKIFRSPTTNLTGKLPVNALRRCWNWFRWPTAIAVLGLLIYQNREGLLQLQDRPKHWGLIAAAVLLCSTATLLTFVRWYWLVTAQGFPFRLREALKLGFLGLLFNYFSLGSTGGDLFKGLILARQQTERRSVALATVVLDRILGLLALLMLGAAATWMLSGTVDSSELKYAGWSMWGGSLAGIVGLFLMLYTQAPRWRIVGLLRHLPLVGHAFGDLLNGILLYQTRRRVIIGSVLLSLVSHSALIGGFYVGALAILPWVPTLGEHFYFMPLAELCGVVVPLPGGIGALEGAIQYFYMQVAGADVTQEAAREAGFVAALMFRAVTLLIAAVGASYYLASRQQIRATLDEISHLPEEEASSAVVSGNTTPPPPHRRKTISAL